MSVRIRPATTSDADGIAAVIVASWRSAYAGLMPADYLAGLDVSARAAQWRDVIAGGRGTVLVAESAAGIVGFAAVGPSLDQSDADTAALYAIYVEPALWDAGVGHALHESAVGSLRDQGCTAVGLWVLRGNVRAITFYERHGWQPDGREQIDRTFPEIELSEIGYSRRL